MDFYKHRIILAMIEGLRRAGSRTGKTHIIKGLMLASAAKRSLIPFRFFLYKHGPYSTEIEENLEEMQSYGALNIEPAFDGYGVTHSPGDLASYTEQRADLSAEEKQVIERVCQFIRGKNVGKLERLATAAWIRACEGFSDNDRVAERLNKLKPHIPLDQAREADLEVSQFLLSQ